MASDYISRKAVLALQTDLHFDGIEQLKHWRCHHIDPTEVEILPAADVRPVVHGGWRPNPRNPYWLDCTVCGYGKPDRVVFNFCPICGADMREEKTDDK